MRTLAFRAMTPVWILACAVLVLRGSACAARDVRRPNFVLLMVDDMGIGDLGCYGNKTLKTPNIDRLAEEGVRLTQHIASAPLCTPSRAGFLTGRYPIRSGMVSQSKVGVYIISAASGGLPNQELTFARLAKDQGYSTALIGKWHLGLNCDRHDDLCHHPSAHGFEHFYGISMTNLRDCQPGHGSVFQHVHTHVPYGSLALGALALAFLHARGVVCVPRRLALGMLGLVVMAAALFGVFRWTFRDLNCFLMRGAEVVEQPFVSENLTRRMTAEALQFLERNSERPFLLFLSFLQVHTALFASSQFQGRSSHGLYGDAVMEVDWSVGEVLRALDRLRLAEQTLVYLTSDQGPHLEEISVRGEVHHGYSGIYRAGKSTNWEGGIRVPGLLRWPGGFPGGRDISDPTSNMDLFPTVVKLAGASIPQDREIDGRDLLPLLRGESERSEHEFLFHYCNAYLNAVRWSPRNSSAVWKVFFFSPIFHPENSSACFHTHACFCTPGYVTYHAPPLLFDLSRDPSESRPLTPDTEPAFRAVLEAVAAATERHSRGVVPVPDQLSPGNMLWKPWLQPCCSSWTRLCRCARDHQQGELTLSH
ncbi:steryl-sulfatase isoform X1 [Alosa alosa]|uniref:steryl-sulfatase isoform X1 n=1 Tax=Alosa alosa TaxID=278164 RepID=UPI00201504BE|nr:steryl-sulfatase isoform X1 [Alosa alosa]